MKSKRTLVVGDVHGCFEEMMELLKICDYHHGSDRLVFVGDIINKGPLSKEVLDWVRFHQSEVVMGNHELAFLKFLKEPNDLHPCFANLRQQLGTDLKFWHSFISGFPKFLRTPHGLIVHGGIEPGCTPEESDVRLLCKIRTWDGQGKHLNRQGIDSPWYQFYHGDELVVYGHWAEQGLTIRKKTIGIDSGCVYGRSLTAISLPDRTIHQVAAKQVYQSLLS